MTDKATTQTDSVPNEPERLLRDARLAQALRHMPDAHMQPGAQTRLAVLRHAQEALAASAGSAAEAPVQTRRWWQSTSPTAWGGALASVLVASFITLMWYDQPVPDANPEGLPAAQEAAAPAAPPALALPSPAPASPPATAMAKAKREEPRATALPQQNDLKETRKPAAPKAAEAPPPPFIPPPEVQVQAVAAPPPAPAPIAPPAVARMSAAPATLAKSPNEFIDIQLDGAAAGTVRRVPASEADALLTYLRGLRDLRTPHARSAGPTTERIGAAAETLHPPITIRTPRGERWEVWPTEVRLQSGLEPDAVTDASAPTTRGFSISPQQYKQLRSLAEATH